MAEITLAASTDAFNTAKSLFIEYAQKLDIDLCFQSFDQELLDLPDMYGSPAGGLLLVSQADEWVGCAGVRRLDQAACELKRMYLRDSMRGMGIGRILLGAALDLAQMLGYEKIRLDTLPSMETAIALYRSVGFTEIPPYRENPVPGALFFEKKLNKHV